MHQIIAGAGVITIDEEVIGLVGELQDVLNGEGQFIEAAADQIDGFDSDDIQPSFSLRAQTIRCRKRIISLSVAVIA